MNDIESPCRKVCSLNDAGTLCTACGRSLAQIRDWSRYTPEQRRAVMNDLAEPPSPQVLAPGDTRPADRKE